MGSTRETPLNGFVCGDREKTRLLEITDRLAAVIDEADGRLAASNDLREILAEFNSVLRSMEWYIDGVKVPAVAMEAWKEAPRNQRRAVLAGITAAIEGLAAKCPNISRVLDSAVLRQQDGQRFAEESRAKRDAIYRERVEWVGMEYERIRCKYQPGDDGDKAARLAVASKYARASRRPRMCDKSVRNILRAYATQMIEANRRTHG